MAEYRFIDNIRDYFNPGYFTEDFTKNVTTEAGLDAKELKAIDGKFGKLSELYRQYKNKIVNGNLVPKYKIEETHQFNTELLKLLGYEAGTPYSEWLYITENSVVPVRHIYRHGAKCTMLIMEMQTMIPVGDAEPDGLFGQHYDEEDVPDVREQRYRFSQWEKVISMSVPEECKINPSIINRAIDEIFTLPQENRRPNYILMLAGNKVFLLDQKEWHNGAYVIFDIEQLLIDVTDKKNKNFLALFYLLCGKDALAGESETALMSRLHEASVKNAYSVTQDLKTGVVNAVETLANEAIHYKREVLGEQFDETQESFAQDVKDDCLKIIYRLLFIFYAEARPDLGILPMKYKEYKQGYSLEMLRDLESVPMLSDEANRGYFFHDSLWMLFGMLHEGYNENKQLGNEIFSIRRIDSPLFDDENLTVLKGVKFRNSEWQKIIRELSLSQEKSGKRRGRISYANLGINQLGSVYESLLAYRGFYAAEEFIEVHKAEKPEDGTYVVPRSRLDDFKPTEILRENTLSDKRNGVKNVDFKNGKIVSHKQHEFIYRLNGLDRKKSASYYTPEVLTKSTVKYSLHEYEEKLRNGEMRASQLLHLKILEPAMGAAAFQNEVINQLADMYIRYYEKEHDMRISAEKRPLEIQKVKAFIATRNTYGVDLNPTAIELGKLSLWLNVMHPNMETPYFGTHLAWGNAVIGAWLKVYNQKEFYKEAQKGPAFKGYELVKWWEKAPHAVSFSKGKKKHVIRKKGNDSSEIYHFLLPDNNMLAILNAKDLKKEFTKEAKHMASIKADWTKPIAESDLKRLRKLSLGIDKLLEGYIEYQCRVEAATASGFEVIGMPKSQRELFSYELKQSISDTRNNSTSEYYKLKTILDYWCSLWFWNYENAVELPNRETYWNDIESIIGLDIINKLDEPKPTTVSCANSSSPHQPVQYTFDEAEFEVTSVHEEEYGDDFIDDSVDVAAPVSKEEADDFIKNMKDKHVLFSENRRTKIVAELAEKYRFFHPMVEFIEVFWLRDGFDIICGNPPWLKYEFKDEDIVQEKYPEVVIRKALNAAAIKKKLASIFEEDESMKSIYYDELINYQGSSAFMNAKCNYPLLEGQQTNLYKCVLENGFTQLSPTGFMGLLHPEGIYDDPNGQPLRKEVYHRLRYHFQYLNEYQLFAEIGHRKTYSTNVYGSYKEVKFDNINNLFIPATIDDCYNSDGSGIVGGIKVDGKWNIIGHTDRIITYTEDELAVLGRAFNEDEDSDCVKLGTIHAKKVLNILEKLSAFKKRVDSYQKSIEVAFDEANDAKAGNIRRFTKYPDMDRCELIYSGPHIFVGNPLYKTPRIVSEQKADYDCLDLMRTEYDYIPRTNYIPAIDVLSFKEKIKCFKIGVDSQGKDILDNWMKYYKVGARKMLNIEGERTLTPAILPPNTAHINGIVSTTFPSNNDVVEFAGITASLVLDFIVKTIGARNLSSSRIESFQMGIGDKYKDALFARILMLNCVNKYYADLWTECWRESYKSENWSIEDDRLKPFSTLSSNWTASTPLRNYFERRQALIEIDVIVAMAIGLSFDDLKTVYQVQFPVLQEYDDETWYDKKGAIVFTSNKGLAGVGLVRKGNAKKKITGWEDICGELSEDGLTYKGTTDSFTYIIPADKSEIYADQEITYQAPYTRCNRIEDYKRAWKHFEKLFNK